MESKTRLTLVTWSQFRWWVGFCKVDSGRAGISQLAQLLQLIKCPDITSRDGEIAGGGGSGLLLCRDSAASFGGDCANLRESGWGCGLREQFVL